MPRRARSDAHGARMDPAVPAGLVHSGRRGDRNAVLADGLLEETVVLEDLLREQHERAARLL